MNSNETQKSTIRSARSMFQIYIYMHSANIFRYSLYLLLVLLLFLVVVVVVVAMTMAMVVHSVNHNPYIPYGLFFCSCTNERKLHSSAEYLL